MYDKLIDQKNLTIRILENEYSHDVMYAAAASPDDKVYFALCAETGFAGTFTKLVCYDPATDHFSLAVDLEKVIHYSEEDRLKRHPHSKIHTSIAFSPEGKLIAATHMTAPPIGEDCYHYWHVCNDPERKFLGSHLIIYDPKTGSTDDFGVVVPGGGARWMTYNPERNEVYITGFLKCHFYAANLNTGEVKDYGRIAQHDYLGPCYSPADGCVYTTDSQGNFLRFRPDKGTIETLPIGIPDDFWAVQNARGIFNLLPSRDGKKLYGTTWLTHHIFEYDPLKGRYGTMRDLGILGDDTPDHYHYPEKRFFPRMLIVGPDDKLYFAAYNAQGKKRIEPHLFSLDPESLEQQNLGRIEVENFPGLNLVASACATSDGTLYFGGERLAASHAMSVFKYNKNGVDKTPEKTYLGKYDTPNLPRNPGHGDRYHHINEKDNNIFMTRGTLVAQEEGMSGVMPLIPRQEGRISALLREQGSGTILGITHGAVPRLFAYFSNVRYFLPLAAFGLDGEDCRNIVQTADGQVYFGTYGKDGGHLYHYDPVINQNYYFSRNDADRGEFTKYYLQPTEQLSRITDLGEMAPGEGVYCMIAVDDKLYGITWPSGDFFIYDPVSGERKVIPCFREYIQRKQNLPQVLLEYEKIIYFSGHHGHIIAYDTINEFLYETSMKIPCSCGREYLTTMTSATSCGDGVFYGGTYADGLLFRMDVVNQKIISLGRPVNENQIRALHYNRDGVLWGISGLDNDVCHLFSYTPEDGVTDEGIMRSNMPKTWIVHCADVMLGGKDGEIFIGENDAISHLLIFYPPIR